MRQQRRAGKEKELAGPLVDLREGVTEVVTERQVNAGEAKEVDRLLDEWERRWDC